MPSLAAHELCLASFQCAALTGYKGVQCTGILSTLDTCACHSGVGLLLTQASCPCHNRLSASYIPLQYEGCASLMMQSVQARELTDMTSKGKELRARIKELTEALEKEQSATSLATKELQVRTISLLHTQAYDCS